VIKIESIGTCQCGTPFWKNAANQTLCPKCHVEVEKAKKRESWAKRQQAKRGYAGINVRDIANDMRKEARYAMR